MEKSEKQLGMPAVLEDVTVDTEKYIPKTAHGDGFAALSLYEKKSFLINREIDRLGFGRYQYCIFFLCGFGYWLDLAFAQLLGLILAPIAQEMGVPAEQQPNIYTAMNVGLTVGALFWGLAVDIWGRRLAFNFTCLITAVFGILIAAPPDNFVAICVLACFTGFGLGGNIPIDATICLEFLPQNRRFVLALLSLFQPLGVTVCTVIAYGFIPNYSCATDLNSCNTGEVPCCTRSSNMGWRYTTIVIGAIALIMFGIRFLAFHFRESPKYLLSRGKDAEAIEVIHSIARFNRAPAPALSMETFEALAQTTSMTSDPTQAMLTGGVEKSGTQQAKSVVKTAWRRLAHLKGLFANKWMTITAILLWIAYMGDFWAFNIAGGFLPIILRRNGVNADQTLEQIYRSYIWIYMPGIGASVIAACLMEIPRVGRKWSMVFGMAMMGVSMFLYATVNTLEASVGLNAMEYVFQTIANALLYAYTPEVFAGPFRGSACGIASTLGRLSGIVAPRAAAPYFARESNGVLYLGAGGAMLAMVSLAFLPVETRGRDSL